MHCAELLANVPSQILLATIAATLLGFLVLVCSIVFFFFFFLNAHQLIYDQLTAFDLSTQFYVTLYIVAPIPREPLPEEKTYRTLSKDGYITEPEPLPCWQDAQVKSSGRKPAHADMEPPEVFMSLVVPAYNEEDRLGGMLEEAVNYLERMYGTLAASATASASANGSAKRTTRSAARQRKPAENGHAMNGHAMNGHAANGAVSASAEKGWEIVIVSDGSKDRTEEMAFSFARDHQLSLHPKGYAGPWTPGTQEGVHIPPGTIRVVTLAQNRGKGGAVTHGMRHVRGQYVVFADADGASNFEDLGKLVTACRAIEDPAGRGLAVGSRAHMVGSEAVVKVRFFSFSCVYCITDKVLCMTALQDPKLSNALIPPNPMAHDTAQDRHGARHAVRIQVVHSFITPLHHPVHAFRGMDLRRGDAHAGGIRAHSRRGSTCRVARGGREQVECAPR